MLLPCPQLRSCPAWPSAEPRGPSLRTALSASPSAAPVSSLHRWETSRTQIKNNRQSGLEGRTWKKKASRTCFLSRRAAVCSHLQAHLQLLLQSPDLVSQQVFAAASLCGFRKEVLTVSEWRADQNVVLCGAEFMSPPPVACLLVHEIEPLTSARLKTQPVCANLELKSSMPNNLRLIL